jgi:hypothetical protein
VEDHDFRENFSTRSTASLAGAVLHQHLGNVRARNGRLSSGGMERRYPEFSPQGGTPGSAAFDSTACVTINRIN